MARFIGCFIAILLGLSFGLVSISLLINLTALSDEVGFALLLFIIAIFGLTGFLKPKWFLWATSFLHF